MKICPHCGKRRDLVAHCPVCEEALCVECGAEMDRYAFWRSGEDVSNDYQREPVYAGGDEAA